MDVNEIYQLIQYISNKNQQGYITPSQFNTVINQAQKSYTSYLLGSFQQYTPGRPVARVELGQNSVLRQRLSPIIYGYVLSVNSTGFSPYPGDYLQADAIRSIYSFERVRFVQQDSLYSYYNSAIDPIATNPIYLLEDIGFRFYPTTISSTYLSYVRNPPDMIWGYSYDSNNRPVYNASVSTQPVWDVASILDIVSRALAMIGVNLQAGTISQYAQEIKVNGQ